MVDSTRPPDGLVWVMDIFYILGILTTFVVVISLYLAFGLPGLLGGLFFVLLYHIRFHRRYGRWMDDRDY